MVKKTNKNVINHDLVVGILYAIAVLITIVYTCYNRSYEEIKEGVTQITIVTFIFLLIGTSIFVIKDKLYKLKGFVRLMLLLIFIVPPLSASACYSIAVAVKDLFFTIVYAKGIFAGLAALLLGLLFFYFRSRARMCYGATEAILGIFVAVHKFGNATNIDSFQNIDFSFGYITASVYLIVRGLDNIQQGRGKDFIVQAILLNMKQ